MAKVKITQVRSKIGQSERHRGTLEIKSIVGEGPSVTVRLPAAT